VRELARSRPAPSRGCLLWVGLPVLGACSGQAFHFDDGQHLADDAGAGEFPGLVTTSKSPDAGSPKEQRQSSGDSSAGGTGGTGGTGSEIDAGGGESTGSGGSDGGESVSTVCGNPRVANADLADGEACIAAGTFMMGTTQPVANGYSAHGPVHSVTLSAYFLDINEVTVARYRRCVDAGICALPGVDAAQGCTYTAESADHEKHPVTCVSWQDGQDFCTWDERRLPTEAEWERAGRGTMSWKYPWGNVFLCSLAVVSAGTQCPTYATQLPEPVGTAATGHSLEGIMDLSGNAAEWVADWFGVYPSSAVTNPTGPASGSVRIQRGGGWLTASADANSYARRAAAPEGQGPYGFRCARDATE